MTACCAADWHVATCWYIFLARPPTLSNAEVRLLRLMLLLCY